MTRFDILTILISITGVLLIPSLILMVKLVRQWTRQEDKLNELINDVGKLIQDKDRVHQEMYRQMREDRLATDKRLRWLEENQWKSARRIGGT